MSRRPAPATAARALSVVLVGLLTMVVMPALARAQSHVQVRIGAALDPATVTVAPGTTVTWVNEDTERHRMAASSGPASFDSGNLDPGERFSHTFRSEGTTSYIDDRNDDDPAYHGTIVVAAGAADPTAPPSAPDDPGGQGEPATHTVSMLDRRFTPRTLEVTTGDTVRFLNDDDRDHTATADDRSFDSGLLAPGQALDQTFTEAGTFSYLCLLHPDMVGTIAVADPGGTAPPPAPAPAPAPAPDPAPAPPTPPDRGAGGDAGAAPQRVTVDMRDFSFAPSPLRVPVGSTVVFRNTGRALHTATADDGSFDSDLVAPGDSYEQRFDRGGTFAYTCLLHPEMVGEVVVTSTAGGSGTAASPGGTGTSGGTSVGASAPAPPPAAPGTVEVSLQDFVFAPADVELRVGDTVRFRNDGAALHTATARDGSYDSGLLSPGGVGEHPFRTAGTFAYWCTLHPDMVATIRVAAADGVVPAPDPLAEGSAIDADVGEAGAGSDAAGSDGVGTTQVSMVDNEFLPAVLDVSVGQEVVWTNDGAAVHTVTADDGAFDSGIVAPGDDFRLVVDEPGTITYLCAVHPEMTAELRVLALTEAPSGVALNAAADDEGLSLATLEVLMLGMFAVALAGFTAMSRRVGALDGAEHS